MKIVSKPPKTGEEFTVSWIGFDGVASVGIWRFNKEDEVFEKKCGLNWQSEVTTDDSFKHDTILVSKGE